MLRKSWLWAMTGAVLMAGSAVAGVFGTVVPIGGEGADLALDQTRGFLYIADFTANRIDVMSLANNQIQTSINVPAQPSSLSISQNGHWLLVAQYGNNTAPATAQNGLTLIDLTNNYAQQNFVLPNPPLGVSFGIDGNALVVTTTEFLVFNPSLGTTTTLMSITAAAAQAIPVPLVNFPPNITGASLAVSADYTAIYGLADNLEFYYDVVHHTPHFAYYTSTPVQGPRAVSVANDGSYAVMGWMRVNQALQDTAEYPNPSGVLNLGGHAVDSNNNVVYSQVPSPPAATNGQGVTPTLQIFSSDNLTLLDTVLIPENLAGKAVIKSDSSVIYALSASGVTVFPVGSLNRSNRLTTSVSELLFLDSFCTTSASSQTFLISDPGGNQTAFTITSSNPGVTVSPASGVTPQTITVSVNPNAFQNQNGTTSVTLSISSTQAVDVPASVTVLVNAPQPNQRGTIVPIPGNLVGLLSDNTRVQYYVLRQDINQVLVFNGTNNTQMATLRTCTQPTSMAETFDGNTLVVGCNNAHIMSVFNLNTLLPLTPVDTGNGYVQSVAISNGMNLAVMRNAAGTPPTYIASFDLILNTATQLSTLGVYQNQLTTNNTVLAQSPNGSTIFVASSDGHTMLYDANVNSFTVSRQDFTSLGGAYAASAYGQYAVGNYLLNSSLVPQNTLTESGTSSGFVFVNQTGYTTSAASSSSPGVIENVNLTTGGAVQPTSMVEAPILAVQPTSVVGTNCSTSTTTGANGTQSSEEICQTGLVQTITICGASASTSGATTTSSNDCTTTTNTIQGPTNAFTQSLVMLQDGSAFINLTTSGVTVLPPGYASSIAPPQINAVVSGADFKSPAAPGGLISVFGTSLSPTNQATSEIPLPTALASSCLTVNGQPIPLIFVSPTQVNAQMPFQAIGDVVMVVHTPAGVSPNFNMVVDPTAPAVFLSGSAGPLTDLPTVVLQSTNMLVTASNPVHLGDMLVIYLTGMGAVSPVIGNGLPGPQNPLSMAVSPPDVTLGGVSLSVAFAGLAPGEVGVYQINATVPGDAPQGLSVPLVISQGSSTQTINDLRVVQ
jgi:uncharacterized protein (TIGR03437 family)